jgi:hypothetical protein
MKFWLKLVGFILLGLVILLIPLFGVYVASAQSLPDEGRYFLKQQSEQIIDRLTTFYPDIYANFSLLKAQRRYQEVIGLVEQDKPINEANNRFIDQVRQTLFDIQSVNDTSLRLNYTAQYQTFVRNAKENLSYRQIQLEEELGMDRKNPAKIFKVDEYSMENGRMVVQKKSIEQQGVIKPKEPASEELLLNNIEELKKSQAALDTFIPK